MLLGAFPRYLGMKAVMKLRPDSRHPLTFKYNKHRNPSHHKCVNADPLTQVYLEGARLAQGLSPYSITAGVPLPQIPVMVIPPARPTDETPVRTQAMDEILIAKAESTVNTKIENILEAFDARIFKLRPVNEPR